MAVKLRPKKEHVEDLGMHWGVELSQCPIPDPNYTVWKLANRFNNAVSRREAVAQLSEQSLSERFVGWARSRTPRVVLEDELLQLICCAFAFNKEKRLLFGETLVVAMLEAAEASLQYELPAPPEANPRSLRKAAAAAFKVLEDSLGRGYGELEKSTKRVHEQRFDAMSRAILVYVHQIEEERRSTCADAFRALCDMGIGLTHSPQSSSACAAQLLCIVMPALARMARFG